MTGPQGSRLLCQETHQWTSIDSKEGGKIGKGNNQNNNNNKSGGDNKSKKQFQGTCNCCGKFSHQEADCHKKEADLKDGKTNNEAAAAAISNGVEFLLMAQESQSKDFLMITSFCHNQAFGLATQLS